MPNANTLSTLLFSALCTLALAPGAHAQSAGPAPTAHPTAPTAHPTAPTAHPTAGPGHAPSGTTGRAPAGTARRPALFHGSFQVTSNTTVVITAPLAQTETRTTHEMVQVGPGNESDLVFDVNSDTGDHCVLNANRNADGSVGFLPGQPCQATDTTRGITLQLELVDGAASVRGDALSLHIRWNVSGSAFFMRIVGTGTQNSTGRRVATTAGRAP